MKLEQFLAMQQNDCSIDCCDTEIDAVVCVESEVYEYSEFPYLTKFIREFRNKFSVVALNPVTINISDVLHHNIAKVHDWVVKWWRPEYAELLDQDDGEWEYQLINEFNYTMAGYKNEQMNKAYYELLASFEEVPDGNYSL